MGLGLTWQGDGTPGPSPRGLLLGTEPGKCHVVPGRSVSPAPGGLSSEFYGTFFPALTEGMETLIVTPTHSRQVHRPGVRKPWSHLPLPFSVCGPPSRSLS